MVGGAQMLFNLVSQFTPNTYALLTLPTSIYSSGNLSNNWLPCTYYFSNNATLYQDDPLRTSKTHAVHKIDLLEKCVKRIGTVMVLREILNFLGLIKNIFQFVRVGLKVAKKEKFSSILGLSDQGIAMISSFILSKLLKIPLSYFLFDIYRGNDLPFPLNLAARLLEHQLFKHAKHLIVNNEGTQIYLSQCYPEFKKKMSLVQNSVLPESYESARVSYDPHPPYLIIYTGNVSWPQEQALTNLLLAMDELTDLALILNLYIPKPTLLIKTLVNTRSNVFLTSAPQSEMPKIQSQATLLFLPLSWNTKAPSIIATATPGKMTDYLGSGRPMLVHAPSYAYVGQYVRQYKLGIVVDQNDPAILAETIRTFLEHPLAGNIYIANALRHFYKNHDARKNGRLMEKILQSI